MPILLLIRHGENDFVKTGRLAGRTPGIHLNERGQQQAAALGEALKEAPITAIYSSPLERAMETAKPIAQARGLKIAQRKALIESNIGDWQGKELKKLSKLPEWKTVQAHPSRFRFPNGESFQEMQTRIVNEIEDIVRAHKPEEMVALVFHADPIKLATAYYLGMPLDHFQRLGCDTASVTAFAFGAHGAHLIGANLKPPFHFPKPEVKKKK